MKAIEKHVGYFFLTCIAVFFTGGSIIGQTTVSFNCTGSAQNWTVPPCVTSISVTAMGASGGGSAGGAGASVTGTLVVTPGQSLQINVGCAGSCPGAGFNGGGAGQNANTAGNASCGGGGASDISGLIIAGGGGGMGGGDTDALGGNGGCNSGANGTSPYGQGGFGGTQTAGGNGGPPWISSGNSGQDGSFLVGGNGATDPCYNKGPGGGGGGGYYGGGGGGSDCYDNVPLGGGSGGGGSSLTPAGGSCTPGANNGNGLITITYTTTAPTVAVNSPVICAGQSATLTASGSPAGGTYSWNTGATTQSITVSPGSTTTYSVTYTQGGCSATVTGTVTVNPAPTVSVNSTTICAGQSATLTASGSPGGGTYSWNTGATTPSITVSPASTTTYTVTYTVSGCPGTGTGTVTVNPSPTSSFSYNGNQCLTGNSFNFSNTGTMGGGTTYSWTFTSGSPGSSTTQNPLGITWSSPGTYTVTQTVTQGGCTATSTQNITIYPMPTVTASGTNVSCNGTADGSVSASGSGGVTYSWDNGLPSNAGPHTGLGPGTYNVTVTDANGCTATGNYTITEPTTLTITLDLCQDVSAPGAGDGAVQITPTGGTTSYTYLWSNSATTQDISGLSGGTYTVTVTDANGCTSTTSCTIIEPSCTLTATASSANASCSGISDGTATANPSSGSTPYSYLWDVSTGNQATQTATGLAGGTTYNVTVTDNLGCTSTASVTVNNSAGVSVSAVVDNNTSGAGICDGQATASGTGGTTAYSYNWDNGQTTATATGLCAGNYCVTITDANGCTDNACITITEPTTIVITSITVNATCNGICNGSADITVTGGITPFSFLWSHGPTAEDPINLCAGNYTVTVTDANSIQQTHSITINEPTVFTVSNTITDASCSGKCDGIINISVSGGTTAYSYSWSNSATTEDITLLCAGSYSVTITDANSCDTILSFSITEPAPITISFSSTDANCGQTDGTAAASAAGGSTPYSYQWDASAGSQTTAGVTDLATGTFVITITDNAGCQAIGNVIIGNQTGGATSATVTSNVACNGGNNGAATASMTGGITPYSYNWSTSPAQTNTSATGLTAGSYNVTITDAVGCADIAMITITEPTPVAVSISGNNVICFGNCDGDAIATANGGTSPYSYQWNNPLFQTTVNATGLCANTFNVTITDANNCTTTGNINISQPAQLILDSDSTNSTCGNADGTATVMVTSGLTPYNYQWGASAGSQTNATATGLLAGCYNVTVTDGNSCTAMRSVCVLDDGSPTILLLTKTNASCNGACDGFAQVSVSGGTLPYSYSWYDNSMNPIGQTTASASNLCAGTYTGETADGNGCIASMSVVITEPTLLVAVISLSTDVTCFGYCDGQATATPSGGTTPYSYQWNDINLQTTQTATGLCPGSYGVTIIDNNNCDTTISVTINEPADIISSTSFTDAFCNTASGQACVTIASGGISPFNYVWDDGSSQTTSCANNLTPGIYNVTVTDANGCTEINSATVGNIPSGTATISSSINVSCNGLCDGQATVSMGGSGTAPYSYDWGNGQTGQTATGICDGNYTVTVTDANTCTATASVIITEPAVLNTGTTGTDTRCYSECSGTATSTASGGTAPYTYLWNNPLAQTDATATGLCSITYQVTVTDGAGCTVIDSVTINEPAPIVLDTNVSNANCGQANGFACLTVTGGIGPYSYLWQDGETTNCISSKVAGTYFVTVTDDNACVAITSAVIQNLNGPTASIASSSDVNCNGVCDGSATVSYSGGTGPITIEWLDNTGTSIGQTTPTASNLCAGTYTVKVKDSVQCIASVTVIINQPPAITYSTSQSNPICTGDCNGSATVTANGGTSPYSYQWNDPNNQTNATATGLCTGNYILNLTDANGCVEIINYMLINPLALTASVSVIDVSCNGLCDGQATTNASNGTTPYSYQWNDSNNQLTQTANGLCAGFYSVTITDINGCTTTANATITEPTALSASISGSGNVSCSGLCDGYAQVSPSGGTPGYIYNWSGGSINQVASNLCAGGYVVTVTDLNGCITQTSVSITQPQPLSTTIPSTSNVNCSGVCNGQATVSVSGGTPSYNYQWSINTGGQISQTVTGLCGGNYSVTVSDANGCASNTNTIITEPNPLGIIINSTTNASCNLDNGSICIGTTGGTAPYTYQWNDPYTQTGACASNLFAGCYLVIVTDANGCTVDSLICINNNAGPTITLNSVSNVICFGGSTGSLSFSVTGGVTPYTSIEWFDGTGTQLTLYSDSLSVSSLPFGNYTIQVIDGVGCIVSLSQFVNQPPNLVASIVSSSDVLCAGGNDGMATVGANGGTTPYSYLWSNGANTTFATGLVAGTYSVTIFDNNGCAKTALATINEPTSMSVSSSVQNISCNNNCNGIIAVTTSGGTAPYIFDWFPNINSNPTATNLCAGNYTVLITDAQGCDTSFNFTITQQQPMIITDTVIPATCGNCNGQATVSVSGGNTPYGYQWDVGQYFPTANGLCPTTHTITITDASGCDSVYSVLITDDSGPVISNINFTEPSCNGTPTGTATVIFSGGISPSPIWDNGFVGITSINLMAGIHCVTVTDFNGCNDVQCVNITEPPALTAIGNGSTTICYGEFAPVWASGAGGTPNYTISWDGGFAGTGPHNVSPTSTTDYCFDIADGNGCIDSACVTITVLPQLSTTVTPGTYVSICEGDSANICINASGGNGGLYDFTWSTGFTETEVTGSCVTANENSSNPFIVTVSDNCSTDETVQIDLNMNPTPTAFFFTNELAGCPPFSVNFSSSSSSLLPVNYAWDFDGDGSIDNNEQNPQAIYSSTGIYDVSLTISTDSGCPTTYNELNYITVWPTPIAGFIADPQTTTLMLSTIEFNTSGLTIGGDSLLIWDFDDGTELSTTDLISSHTYEETGTYSVLLTAYNQYGCSDTATGIVVIKDDFILFAPNAFTPINNDGKNDYFMPKGVGINPNNFAMYIFDRWGDIIYETHNPDKPWDGKVQSKSKLVKQDVYVWIVVTVDENDDDVQFIGHVTVVK